MRYAATVGRKLSEKGGLFATVLYEDYDPRTRLLPGGRWAYDKGADPFALVLSMRWDLWKEQTRRYFQTLDPALLPVSSGRALRPKGYVIADSPVWKWIGTRLKVLGVQPGPSFNTEFAMNERSFPARKMTFWLRA